jgi:aspartyl-tRNA(Asn)/glutamyl-tRNA(Gln) amidotransferase subunit B
MEEFDLPEYDAALITASRPMADYFEAALGAALIEGAATGDARNSLAKSVSNWMREDLSRLLNASSIGISDSLVTPPMLVELIGLVDSSAVSVTLAKTVLEEAFNSGGSPATIVRDRGYTQINDSSSLGAVVREAIESNPKAVADFLQGKDSAAKFLVGQVMRITRGQANPEMANQLIALELESIKNTQSTKS